MGRYQGRYGGRDSVWVFRHIPETRAFLAVTAPVEQVAARLAEAEEFISAGIRGQLLLLLLVLLLVGGAVSALAYPIAASVTAPLASLAGTARAIASGRFDSRARVRRKDEIALLAVAINKMAVSIQKLIKEQEKPTEPASSEQRVGTQEI
jgi:methyl-accepting chemotaxis protein